MSFLLPSHRQSTCNQKAVAGKAAEKAESADDKVYYRAEELGVATIQDSRPPSAIRMGYRMSTRKLELAFSPFDRMLRLAHVFVRNSHSEIVYWSPGAQEFYGYTSEEALGSVSNALLKTQFPEPLPMIESRVYSDGEWQGELVQTTKSGELRNVASHWSVYRDGGADFIVEVNNDATGMHILNRRLEEALKEAEQARGEAEQANRAKDRFISMVSHELRTPLNPIALWTAMLLSDARRDRISPERTIKGLRVIEHSVRTQTGLINDLLDASRVMSGRLQMRFEPIDLSEVALAVAQLFGEEAREKGLALRSETGADDVPAMADRPRIEQVIGKLISNAIKFTPCGGSVTVSTRRDEHGWAEVRVCDTGRGIADAEMAALFQFFSQAQSGVTTATRGLGLSLAICRSIVEGHGGRLEARSEGAGKGAAFTIKLPLSSPVS
jgi:PAS domain S-box-containing protein